MVVGDLVGERGVLIGTLHGLMTAQYKVPRARERTLRGTYALKRFLKAKCFH